MAESQLSVKACIFSPCAVQKRESINDYNPWLIRRTEKVALWEGIIPLCFYGIKIQRTRRLWGFPQPSEALWLQKKGRAAYTLKKIIHCCYCYCLCCSAFYGFLIEEVKAFFSISLENRRKVAIDDSKSKIESYIKKTKQLDLWLPNCVSQSLSLCILLGMKSSGLHFSQLFSAN